MTQQHPGVEIDSHNAAYVEQLWADYLHDASSVSPAWRSYFAALPADGNGVAAPANGRPQGLRARPRSLFNPSTTDGASADLQSRSQRLQECAERLIRAYRVRGHLVAKLDPLGMARPDSPELSLAACGLREGDLDQSVEATSAGGPDRQTIRELHTRLTNTYCRHIGAQFMHIDDLAIRDWLAQRMESTENRLTLPPAQQRRILSSLTDAVAFEEFIRKKYVGAKTFSLEGSETLIPLLMLAIDEAAEDGVQEIVIAMPHRGRLNVLTNIVGKAPREIFREFEDRRPRHERYSGDVAFHLGYSGDWTTANGHQVHLSLCFNPSHLEFVNPVAVGRVRAKQDRTGDAQRRRGMALLIHGDAAIAGQGVVQETFNLSQLPAYTTGGSLHVIVNNQLGFTTNPSEARSTLYPSDIARMLQIPIFHVNGEYPEAVAQVVRLALDFRAAFGRDVVIDMFCYRRWGHNEADEPSFTQPQMYQAIEHRPPVGQSYLKHLIETQAPGLTPEDAQTMAKAASDRLAKEFEAARSPKLPAWEPDGEFSGEGGEQAGSLLPRETPEHYPVPMGVWQGFSGGPEPADDDPDTGVPKAQLQELLRRLAAVPEQFHLHKKLQRSVEARRQMAEGDRPLDWSAAEALAFATLAVSGHRVRLSGQDSVRGTFSQRHAVLHDVVDGHHHDTFANLAANQAPIEIINSPLSEAGVMGFDYGYSLDYPAALVLWEAQFGDFVNAAQVIIDQFLASAEDKWQRLSGIVLLLPHGFEGQGPEHSSARQERFLVLAAEDNLQLVSPTTPAQYFHCLRRQVLRRWRKPLVILTPKSLLRDPQATSSLDDLASGRFERVLPDRRPHAQQAKRVLLCGGKLYYELAGYREKHDRSDVAIVRVEQFYPLSDETLNTAFAGVSGESPVFWVQEEPLNMGAWPYWRLRYGDRLLGQYSLRPIARSPSPSPASGSKSVHRFEQQELIQRAFADQP